MSTRATLIIKDSNTGEKCYLYHHCDGYCLDEDLDEVLEQTIIPKWNVAALKAVILNMDDTYGTHKVDDVGWDSEYVYVIDVADRTLKKYECGLWFKDEHQGETMSIEEEKTQEKYRIGTWAYGETHETSQDNTLVADLEVVALDADEIADLSVNINEIRVAFLRGIAASQKLQITDFLKRILSDEEIKTVFKLMAE